MRIGLIRHFPVVLGMPTGWKTWAELQAWRRDYDLAEVTCGPADLGGVAWALCFSSDLPRACATASAVFSGPITQTALLREVEFAEFPTGTLRLPARAWRWVLQLSWATGHRTQRACRDEFMRRILELADRFEASTEDTLVVSHAGVMAYLSAELRRRGFAGPKLRLARHAQVYVYEKVFSSPQS